MKRTLSLVGLFVVGLALLLSPQTGILSATTSGTPTTTVEAAAPTTTTGEPPPDGAATTEAAAPDTTSAPPTTTPEPATEAVLGPAVDTEFGSFQVEIVVVDGTMVDIVLLEEPSDRKSQSINARAVPAYEANALETQSADIDLISGATITWQAYGASLQAAIDEAGLTVVDA